MDVYEVGDLEKTDEKIREYSKTEDINIIIAPKQKNK